MGSKIKNFKNNEPKKGNLKTQDLCSNNNINKNKNNITQQRT